jgi:PAS domain S-box-containing protein
VYYRIDLEGKVEMASPSFLRVFGYDAMEEVVGRPVAETFYEQPGERQYFLDFLNKHRQVKNYELKLKGKDGRLIDCDITSQYVYDDNGVVVGIEGMLRDITAHKAAEEALRESEKLLRAYIDAIPQPAFLLDRDGNFLAANDIIRKSYEITGRSLVGKYAFNLLQPSLANSRRAYFERVIQSRQAVHFEDQGSNNETFINYMYPVLDPAGEVSRVAVFALEITELKQAEKELRNSENRYRTLMEQAADGIFIADAEGRYVDVNSQGCAMTQYTREEILGFSMKDLVVPEDIKSSPLRLPELNAGKGLLSERHMRRRDGTTFLAEISAKQLADGRLLGIVRDVTERVQAQEKIRILNTELEQRVQQRTAELEAVNKELEAFSYSVSHDLRGPLRTIDGFAHILLEDYSDKLDAEGQRQLLRMRTASQRMGELINDLLDLSRVTRFDLRHQMVDLSGLAHSVADGLRQAEPERKAEFIIAAGMQAYGDERLLKIVLENLIGNAWKFTARHPDARIEVGKINNDGDQTYFVRDDGAGFDMTYANKLFGAFQRLHPNSKFEGTGIGLATVQRIISRHGGRVWAEGAVEQGATFYFTLPGKANP